MEHGRAECSPEDRLAALATLCRDFLRGGGSPASIPDFIARIDLGIADLHEHHGAACRGALFKIHLLLPVLIGEIERVRASNGEPDLFGTLDRIRDLGVHLDLAAANVRLVYPILDGLDEIGVERAVAQQGGTGPGRISELLALDCLSRFLPAADRSRFVGEAQGNLGDCKRWWQRVDQLVCLALGMPRLAWMMWRDGRRGRA